MDLIDKFSYKSQAIITQKKQITYIIFQNMTKISIYKANIYKQALKSIKHLGFNSKMLEESSKNAGYEALFVHTIFHNGIDDFALYMMNKLDKKMTIKMVQLKEENPILKVRELIFLSIKTRIEIINKNKSAYKALFYFYSNPCRYNQSLTRLWKTADIIWYIAKDNSTDFNYYSKRTLLSTIYSLTMLYWLSDKSPNSSKTLEFLQKTIDRVLSLQKFKFKKNTT